MKISRITQSICFVALTCSLSIGCGDGASSAGNAALLASMQMDAQPCTATFNEDYQVVNFFGDPKFTVKAGETFIVSHMNDWGSNLKAELYYLVDEGAYDFDVEIEGTDSAAFPFDLSCANQETSSYLGVFSDTVVYTDEELTQEACTLSRGASAKVEFSSGHALVSELFQEPAIYRVQLASFSNVCGELEEGYVEARPANVFGTSTVLVPILSYQTSAN